MNDRFRYTCVVLHIQDVESDCALKVFINSDYNLHNQYDFVNIQVLFVQKYMVVCRVHTYLICQYQY